MENRKLQKRIVDFRSRRDRSSGELADRKSGHVHHGSEQGARQRILVRIEAFSGGGDEELVKVRTAECAGSNLFGCLLDYLVVGV
jgi:hypothetical protein